MLLRTIRKKTNCLHLLDRLAPSIPGCCRRTLSLYICQPEDTELPMAHPGAALSLLPSMSPPSSVTPLRDSLEKSSGSILPTPFVPTFHGLLGNVHTAGSSATKPIPWEYQQCLERDGRTGCQKDIHYTCLMSCMNLLIFCTYSLNMIHAVVTGVYLYPILVRICSFRDLGIGESPGSGSGLKSRQDPGIAISSIML